MTPSVPTVSIIMPTFNCSRYIAEAIRSVQAQTRDDWELLIFDDGSSDDTESVVAPFLADPRIVYTKQENRGQPRTRNQGVKQSRGRYIALLDADDLWKPEKLARQIALLEKYPEVGVAATGLTIIDPDSRIVEEPVWNDFRGRALPALVTQELKIGMSSSVTRRGVFETVGYFDEGFLPFSMDFDFWLRAALHFDFALIGDNLTLYRMGRPSISSQGGSKRRDMVLRVVIPRFLNEYGGAKYVKPRHVRALWADCYKENGDRSGNWWNALFWYLRAISCSPCSPAVWRGAAGRLFPRLVRILKRTIRP